MFFNGGAITYLFWSSCYQVLKYSEFYDNYENLKTVKFLFFARFSKIQFKKKKMTN